MGEKLGDVTMQLTYMEEEGTEILVENIQKKLLSEDIFADRRTQHNVR